MRKLTEHKFTVSIRFSEEVATCYEQQIVNNIARALIREVSEGGGLAPTEDAYTLSVEVNSQEEPDAAAYVNQFF